MHTCPFSVWWATDPHKHSCDVSIVYATIIMAFAITPITNIMCIITPTCEYLGQGKARAWKWVSGTKYVCVMICYNELNSTPNLPINNFIDSFSDVSFEYHPKCRQQVSGAQRMQMKYWTPLRHTLTRCIMWSLWDSQIPNRVLPCTTKITPSEWHECEWR